MSSNKWAKNVILVDAVFLDKMGYIFRSNYERLLKRDVNKADLAIWLESAHARRRFARGRQHCSGGGAL